MEKYNDQEYIIRLLKRYLEDNAEESTRAEVEAWLEESEENVELLRRLESREILVEKMKFRRETDMEEDWQAICRATKIGKSRSLVRRWWGYAATIAGIGIMLGLLYTGEKKESEVMPVAQVAVADTILPGSRQAFIVLANGERIRLGDAEQRIEKNVEGGKFVEGGAGLVVTSDNKTAAEVQTVRFNKLEVPKGGEYELMLADGTKVWLNSDSELEFPMAFHGAKRQVRLKGEAYFEVKHDDKKPFEVHMDGMEILVLGTSFNAFAYGGEVNTTLVKGSVEVHAKGGHYKLVPGEQASLVGEKISVEKVDVAEHIGWKEGKFIFRSKRLEEVMAILSRWYNLNVVYQNEEVKGLHFTGNIPRHATVAELLSILERTHLVHFTVQGRTVVVSE